MYVFPFELAANLKATIRDFTEKGTKISLG